MTPVTFFTLAIADESPEKTPAESGSKMSVTKVAASAAIRDYQKTSSGSAADDISPSMCFLGSPESETGLLECFSEVVGMH